MNFTLPVMGVSIVGRVGEYDSIEIDMSVPKGEGLESQHVNVSIKLAPGTAERYLAANFPDLRVDYVYRIPKQLTPFSMIKE